MQTEYKIVKADEALVDTFINNLIKGAAHFRYFSNRPVSVIQNHLLTLVVTDQTGYPVGYGHLENEDGIAWLGVAVADKSVGKGIGSAIVKYLIDFAKNTGEMPVYLSVDADNNAAQNLYKKVGFEKIEELSNGQVLKFVLK